MNHENGHKYDDILRLPHHVSKKHPQMPAINRAAQFSPFAALSGFDDAISEAERPSDTFAEPDEDRKEQLNLRLLRIWEHLSRQPEVTVTFFRPDEADKPHALRPVGPSREGCGSYVTVQGCVKKIDAHNRQILFADGTAVPLEFITSIEGGLFDDML